MSTVPLMKGRRNRLLITYRSAFSAWISEDAPTLGYLLKVLLGSLFAMWLSLKFELEQPRTAMLTVAIVMQSRSGMVFAKSYYRLLGSLVGILISLILVALFAQERVLFMLSVVLWIGVCTAGSMVYRNHQSYAFVLAGYTICIVGLPAAINPDLTFSIAVTRISEILIGLISATMVSDLIFPQRLWDVIQAKIRQRFCDFSDLLRTTAQSSSATDNSKQALLRLIGDIYSLETFRASAIMENDGSRQNSLCISEMNNEFMAVSTTFHALEELLRRQKYTGHPEVGEALVAMYKLLSDAITLDEKSARNEQQALAITNQLNTYRNTFNQNLNAYRVQLPKYMSAREFLDFETGSELLQRLAEELHAYAFTYASLSHSEKGLNRKGLIAPPKLKMHFDSVAVALAGVRGTLTLAIMTMLWLFTDWRSGVEAMTIGVITSTIFASSPSPNRTIKQFMIGAIIGTVLAYICNFHLLTHAQGFWMLALAVTPTILFASWLTTKPSVAVVGSGIFIVFLMHVGFNNGYNANPVSFINDAIADLLAVLVSGAMYDLIDISSSKWSRKRIVTALRGLIVSACQNPLIMKRAQLENAAIDLVQRSGSAQRIAEEQDKLVIDWLLSTLEIGHAVIALREFLPEINHTYFSELLLLGLKAIAELYENPSEFRRMNAQRVIDNAIDNLSSHLSTDAAIPETEQECIRQVLSTLHYIHSALLDEESVLVIKDKI
jgi:uncharacterized membrane protein YccC